MGNTIVSGESHSSFRNPSFDWVTQMTASPCAASFGSSQRMILPGMALCISSRKRSSAARETS